MALDVSREYKIRNSAGREYDVPGDVLLARILNRDGDVILEGGREIPAEIYLVQSESNPFSSAEVRDDIVNAHAQAIAPFQVGQEVSEVVRQRALRARANEVEMAAQQQAVRAAVRLPGSAERVAAQLAAEDSYNAALGSPIPVLHDYAAEEDQQDAAAVAAERIAEFSAQATQEANEAQAEVVREQDPGSIETGVVLGDK